MPSRFAALEDGVIEWLERRRRVLERWGLSKNATVENGWSESTLRFSETILLPQRSAKAGGLNGCRNKVSGFKFWAVSAAASTRSVGTFKTDSGRQPRWRCSLPQNSPRWEAKAQFYRPNDAESLGRIRGLGYSESRSQVLGPSSTTPSRWTHSRFPIRARCRWSELQRSVQT